MNVLLIIMMLHASEKPTPTKVYNYCVEQGIKYPMIVTAQSILETGWYKSYKDHNILGIYNSNTHEYNNFKDWRECVRKYKHWIQDRYYKQGDYFEFLLCMWKSKNGNCKKYATDTNYIWKLKSIMKRLKKLLNK